MNPGSPGPFEAPLPKIAKLYVPKLDGGVAEACTTSLLILYPPKTDASISKRSPNWKAVDIYSGRFPLPIKKNVFIGNPPLTPSSGICIEPTHPDAPHRYLVGYE